MAIIQARMGSTRLPGKIMMDIAGRPALEHVVDRLRRSELIDTIVIATTTNEEDKPVIELAGENGVKSYAGSAHDVLDRYLKSAREFGADIIVRITADCPLIDPRVADKVIKYFLDGNFHYVSNTLRATYPDGLDTEVFSYQALEKAWQEAKKPSEREHVVPYIRNNERMFKLGNVACGQDLSQMRWTVDMEQDLTFVREIYDRLYKKGEIFYMEDVLALLEENPALMEINKGIIRDEGYLKSLEEDKAYEAQSGGPSS